MNNETQPAISSFVIRFVRESAEDSEESASYRGAIRHVQTDEEVGFTQWQDAVNFIEQYIPIHELNQKE